MDKELLSQISARVGKGTPQAPSGRENPFAFKRTEPTPKGTGANEAQDPAQKVADAIDDLSAHVTDPDDLNRLTEIQVEVGEIADRAGKEDGQSNPQPEGEMA